MVHGSHCNHGNALKLLVAHAAAVDRLLCYSAPSSGHREAHTDSDSDWFVRPDLQLLRGGSLMD